VGAVSQVERNFYKSAAEYWDPVMDDMEEETRMLLNEIKSPFHPFTGGAMIKDILNCACSISSVLVLTKYYQLNIVC
jgi:hypothetical protein